MPVGGRAPSSRPVDSQEFFFFRGLGPRIEKSLLPEDSGRPEGRAIISPNAKREELF